MEEAVAGMMTRVHDIIWYRTGGVYDWQVIEQQIDDFVGDHMQKGTKKVENVVQKFEQFMDNLMGEPAGPDVEGIFGEGDY